MQECFYQLLPGERKRTTVGMDSPDAPTPKKRRGFAAMDPKLVAEIARKGGIAAHRAGTAHEFTQDEARAAGRKGGKATHEKLKRAAGSTDTE